jgi:hypothetical protein
MKKPPFFTRLFFWLLLGLLSTFFAEVLSGSAPYFLLEGFGYYGIFPIYCLHTLFLASITISNSRPFTLRTLYFASLLFGMYEAYITKVLWSPPWQPDAFRIGGVAVVETILLVFFWHAVISFLVPLFIGENLLTTSRYLRTLIPAKWQRRLLNLKFMAVFGVFASILAGTAISTVEKAFIIVFFDCLVVTGLMLVWRFFTRRRGFYLIDLLPRGKELVGIGILLVFDYIYFGLILRREALPDIEGHLSILLLYTTIILLLICSIHKDKQAWVHEISVKTSPSLVFTFKHWLVFCSAFTTSVFLINFLPQEIQDLLFWFVITANTTCGLIFFSLSIRNLFKKERQIV